MASHAHHEHDNYYLDPAKWTTGRNVLVFAALVAWVALAVGYTLDHSRFFESYLLAFCFGTFVILAGMFFVFVQFLSGSAWSVSVRRFMENLIAAVPAGLLLFVPVALGLDHLYHHWMDTQAVLKDNILRSKMAYLNENAFLIRAVVFFVLWSIWAYAVSSQSAKQDKSKSIAQMHACSRWSAPGLFLVMLSGSLAAFDWIMSLDPHWYSTIFGIYVLAGSAVAMMAIVTLIATGFQSFGELKNSITEEHYHDLGKWMFALSCFWAYIAASQYLLIWYANIPEETIWYKHRMEGSWLWVSLLLPVGRFILPFVLLIPRAMKRNVKFLRVAAVWLIFMHLVDLYWLIMPTFQKHGFQLHWMDLAALVAVVSTYGLFFWWRFKSNAMVVVGDLRFEQGLHFHQV
jgi:hypothetical protein